MIKRRLEREIDHKIQDMQFEFRRNRSTSQALIGSKLLTKSNIKLSSVPFADYRLAPSLSV
eukprot:9195148-Prorocentrum_lima.AAC.1